MEVSNPADGIDLEYSGTGATLVVDGDNVTVEGTLTSSAGDTDFAIVANCPLNN